MRLLHIGIAFLFAATGFADIITLKSGRVINGTYLGGTAREVKVQIADQVETFDVSQVSKIEFGSGSATTASTGDRPTLHRAGSTPPPQQQDDDRPTLRRSDSSSSSSAPPRDDRPTLRRSDTASSTAPPADDDRPTLRRDTSSGSGQDQSQRPAGILHPGESEATAATTAANVNAPSETVTLPAGTNLTVRMIEEVDSEKATVGQTFKASLMEAVTAPGNGNVVLPRGSDVVVKLVNAKESGKFTGKAELTLSLWSVKVGERVIDVDTQTVTKESDSRGAKTATMTGGGAVLGAVIGGLAGGGKGAAIGAAAGAGAGAGAEAITKGQRVKIPSETRLTFVLDNPVKI